jgi:AraC-like DNA-binding protein
MTRSAGVRGSSDGYSSAVVDQLVVRSADRSLRPYVSRYWGYAHTAPAPGRQREPLSTGVVLTIGMGVPLGIADPREPERKASWFGSFVGGLDDRCAVIEQGGEMRGVQVDLSPLAARMVLRASMGALAREVVALDDLLGPDAHVLEERLVDARGWGERFDVVEAMLRRKLAAAEPPPPDVEWAWWRLLASHGRLRVSDLTSELGCSRKHLAARFREHVGLPAKVYARMLRFRRATDLLSAGQSIAETAAECGYYDQPHLDRDFREFAGTTPSAYLAERVTFVQDATAADS